MVAKAKEKLTREKLDNLGSLITIRGTNRCLGALMVFPEHGTFCPANGLVPVTPEETEAHNKALDEAMLQGLDENCEIGQGGSFYLSMNDERRYRLTTFLGTIVADCTDVKVTGKSVTFCRKGKTYRGRMSMKWDLFNFRRVK